MNANEVIASPRRPGRRRRSTPTTTSTPRRAATTSSRPRIHVAATLAVVDDLLPALDHLATSFEAKAERVRRHRQGRAHAPDGRHAGDARPGVRRRTPPRCGSRVERLEAVLPRVRELPLGGTAVGTGINTPAGFAARGDRRARRARPGSPSPRRATTSRRRAPATRSSSCPACCAPIAVGLTKICNDLRWMSSGPDDRARRDPPARPAAGVEHHARQGQPGAARGDADGLRAGHRQRRDHRLRRRGRQLRAQRDDAGDGARPARVDPPAVHLDASLLADRCVDGITADAERMRRYAESSPSVVTPLNAHIGYEKAAKVAKKALAEGATIRETVIDDGLRRARRPHRGAARRRPRRRLDDGSPDLGVSGSRSSGSGRTVTGMSETSYDIKPLTPETWPPSTTSSIRHNGMFGGCWCIWFHPDGPERGPGQGGQPGAQEALRREGRGARRAGLRRRRGDRVGGVRHTRRAAQHPPPQAVRRRDGRRPRLPDHLHLRRQALPPRRGRRARPARRARPDRGGGRRRGRGLPARSPAGPRR